MFGKKPPVNSGSMPVPTPQPEENNRQLMGGTSHLPATIGQEQSTDSLTKRARQNVHEGKASQPYAEQSDLNFHGQQTAIIKYTDRNLETSRFMEVRRELISDLVDKIDIATLYQLPEERRRKRIYTEAGRLIQTIEAPLTAAQISLLQEQAINEILGYGPLEPLLADPDVSDIMINTAQQVYIEKSGKIYLTDVTFMNEGHLMAIIQRIVTRVGRRVDEASPMVDARLPDGSRFNAIVNPIALDGALVSIRKFKKSKISLSDYVQYNSLTPDMATFLSICAHIRLNIIISGGTGSGKTTLLNALSNYIDHGERVITIEDAAELQLAQPHVLRLETRPMSNEGAGEITQRQLVKNALRMRPDRIILGEIRGDEVIDVLSAMNTGHDGSLATIHSNSPRDCLSRIENLVNMSGVAVSNASLRYQISSAVQLIIQLQRMRDGRRRITHIEEIVGQEGESILTQTLFSYKPKGIDSDGMLMGEFVSHNIRPRFLTRAEYYNMDGAMLDSLGIPNSGGNL